MQATVNENALPVPSVTIPPQTAAAAAASSTTSGDLLRNGSLINRIVATDIQRIDRYLKIANIGGGAVFAIVGIVALFTIGNYSDFIIALDIILLGLTLIWFEFRENFPVLCEKVKQNFGFLFNAIGRAVFIAFIGLLSFTQGIFGIIVGVLFLLLAGFNFFLIHKHPHYQKSMTAPKNEVVPNTMPVVQVVV